MSEGGAQPLGGARTLREVELQEMEHLRRVLYTSPLHDEKVDTEKELMMHDTLRAASETRKELMRATMRPIKEKMKDFQGFMQLLGNPQHKRVAGVFLTATVSMFTIPILVLIVGMHLVAPHFRVDAGVCGGILAVLSTIVIMAAYVVYAFLEPDAKVMKERVGETKKDQ